MKRLLYILLLSPLMIACQNNEGDQAVETSLVEAPELSVAYFGSQITEDGAQDAATVLQSLAGSDSVRMKVTGRVDKVCQVKGCWMTMDVGQAEPMHVTFKDYSFFVPKNIDGKEAVIEGYARMETLTVDEQKHYAQDEGKSQAEIDAITEDKVTLSFVADGVIVKDYKIGSAEETSEASETHDHSHEHAEATEEVH